MFLLGGKQARLWSWDRRTWESWSLKNKTHLTDSFVSSITMPELIWVFFLQVYKIYWARYNNKKSSEINMMDIARKMVNLLIAEITQNLKEPACGVLQQGPGEMSEEHWVWRFNIYKSGNDVPPGPLKGASNLEGRWNQQ